MPTFARKAGNTMLAKGSKIIQYLLSNNHFYVKSRRLMNQNLPQTADFFSQYHLYDTKTMTTPLIDWLNISLGHFLSIYFIK